jgi:PAS domain S-box-containing protein
MDLTPLPFDDHSRLEAILEGTRAGTWEWNVQTGETVFNERWAEIAGYTLDELAPVSIKTWEALAHPGDLQRSGELLARHFAGELAYYDCDCRIRHKDGRWVWVRDHGKVASRTPDGQPLWMFGTHIDITERKQLTESLQESERKWRNILVNTPQIGLSLDPHARIVFVNKRFLALTGWTEDEVLGRDWFDLFIPGEIREEIRAAFDTIMRSGNAQGVSSCENDILIKNGGRRHVAWSNVVTSDANGIIVDVTCLGIDLTERQRAEEALRSSEEHLRVLVENAPDAIFVQTQHRFAYLNPAAVRCFGAESADQLLGQPVLDRFEPRFHDRVKERIRQLNEEKVAAPRLKQTYLKMDGSPFEAEVSATPIHWQGQDGALVFFRDITEQEKTKEDVLDLAERLNLALTSARAGVWDWNLKANELIWDDRMLDLYGLTRENFPGGSEAWEQGLHPEDSARAIEECQAALRGERDFDTEFRVRHPDGTVIHMKANGLVQRDEEGNPIRMVGVNTDITARRKAEDALRVTLAKYQTLFNCFPVGITVSDKAGNILEANPMSERLLGISQEEHTQQAIDSPRWQIVRPDDTPMASDEYASVRALKEQRLVENVEMGIVKPDGSTTWISVNAAPLPLEGYGVVVTYGNITERKRLERDYLTLFAGMLDGFAVHEVICDDAGRPCDYRFLDINPAFERLTGQGRDIIGKTVLEVLPGIEPHWIEAYGRVALTGEPAHFENVSAGIGKWFEVTAFRNAPRQFTCMFVDVTSRKRAEETLRESEAKFRSIAEQLPEMIALTDEAGAITYASPASVTVFGVSPSAMTGQRFTAFVDEASIPAAAAIFRDVVQSGRKLVDLEFRMKKGDGSGFVGELSGERYESASGRGTLVTIRDITEYKRLELDRQRFYRLAESSSEFIGMCDLDMQPLYVNPAGQRMVGLPDLAAACRVKVQDYFFPEDQKFIAEELFPRVLREGQGDVEIRFRHFQTGEALWFFYNLFNVRDASGNVIGWATVSRDITERKQAEAEREKLQAQLAQAQKMESVGRLAGGVAHDFNNMLGAILGNISLALQELPPESPAREYLQEIADCARRSADLTRQLLAFARKQTISPRVLDLNDTVAGMLKMLRRLIGEDIDLAWLPGANLGLVHLDPTQVDQLLANLCVNARDAIKGVGKITIETGNVVVDETYVAGHVEARVGEYVRLAVSDNGCGMSPEVQAHLFEPFFTTKGVGQGTGLGLATVYGIAKQNHGFISVYSEPGQGTTFQIHLPRHAVPAVSPAGLPDAPAPSRGHETILLVEDELSLLRVIRRVLENLGYRVLAARTPGEALQLAREHAGTIHLLMTDVVMPEMNGRDLAKNLLSQYPHLKRLFMSGYTANVIAHHGVLDPGIHFLQKPFSVEAVADKVREALGGGDE